MQIGYLHSTVMTNLRKVMSYLKIDSARELSLLVKVKEETIESWFLNNRTPKITTLDKIANKLNVPTYILFQNDLKIDETIIYDSINNNSSDNLEKNLKNEYLKRSKASWNEISSIYSGFRSIDTLKSYHRKTNKITPPLKTLEKLSSYLGIPASELLKEVHNEENKK